jgi:hypothetical protein
MYRSLSNDRESETTKRISDGRYSSVGPNRNLPLSFVTPLRPQLKPVVLRVDSLQEALW